MTKSISIELTKDVAEKFLNQFNQVDSLAMPGDKVELILYNYLTNKEKIMDDVKDVMALANKEQGILIQQMLTDYCSSNISIKTKPIEHGVHIIAKSTYEKAKLSEACLIDFTYVEGAYQINQCDLTKNYIQSMEIAQRMLGLVSTVLTHLNKPTTVKTVESVKIPRTKKKRVKGKKSPVRYVYKTIYKVSQVGEPQVTKGVYKEREYVKEEWERKGHYRAYRDKETGEIIKEVWIKPATCKARGKIKENQNYKITKSN